MSAVQIEVPARELFRLISEVKPFAGIDDTLPMLCGVLFETEGDYLIGACTDRYTMGASRLELDKTPGKLRWLMGGTDVAALQRIFRPERRSNPALSLTFDGPDLTVTTLGGLPGLPAVEARFTTNVNHTFPAYRSLFERPKADATLPAQAGFNPAYLAKFQHAQRGHDPVIITHAAANKPMLLHVGDHFAGLIMPVRLSENEDVRWWIEAEKPPAKPAPKKAPAKAAAKPRARKGKAA